MEVWFRWVFPLNWVMFRFGAINLPGRRCSIRRGLKWFLDAVVGFSLHAVPSHCLHQRQQQPGRITRSKLDHVKNWWRVLNILSPGCCLTTSLWDNWQTHLSEDVFLESRINLSYLSQTWSKRHDWSDIWEFWSTLQHSVVAMICSAFHRQSGKSK